MKNWNNLNYIDLPNEFLSEILFPNYIDEKETAYKSTQLEFDLVNNTDLELSIRKVLVIEELGGKLNVNDSDSNTWNFNLNNKDEDLLLATLLKRHLVVNTEGISFDKIEMINEMELADLLTLTQNLHKVKRVLEPCL